MTSVTIPNSVTTIESDAFYYCSSLTSIDIPNSVTSIGNEAFYQCFDLTSVTIPNSVTTIGSDAFYYCYRLTSVTIGNSVTTIGSNAFYKCSGLTSVTIGNSVKTIGSYAFSECFGLTKTNYTGTIADWCKIKFSSYNPIYYSHNLFINDVEIKDLIIPEGVETIGRYAFAGCSGLTSVTIPNSVTEIGDEAFYNVNNITYSGTATGSPWGAKCVNGYVDGYLVYSDATKTTLCGCSSAAIGAITIPNSVTTIGNNAFYYCSGLASVTIGNSVTTIGSSAFRECSGLTSVTIGNSVKTIGSSAFYNCSGLTSVTIPNSVATIGYEAFRGCTSLTSVTIPNSVTAIGDFTFYNCSSLTSVTIGNSVTTIGNKAFEGCDGLTKTNYTGTIADWCKIKFSSSYSNPISYSHNIFINNVEVKDLVIPEGVETIGSYAFDGCSGLTSVTIGNSVKTIGSSAFEGCKGLKTVYNNSNLNITKGSTANGYVAYYADKVYKGIPVGDFIIKQDTIVTAYIGSATDIVIPNFVTTIGNSAFEDCDDLTSIIISNSVTSIGERAFYGLSNKDFKTIEVSNSVETIGKYAFANCSYLKTITLGSKLEDIDEYAFQNDERLLYVNCYAEEPPILQENAFDNYDIYLQVPCGVLDEYKVAKGWKLFNKENVSCISAEETPITTDDVTVVPADNQAIFTWPQNEQAAGYSIEITKDGVVFCTLKFNGQGQLTGIAFAPGRGGEQSTMPAAEMTANGWQFTVTGLDQASKYGYTLDALNASQQSIKHYEGEFYTDGYTGLDGFTIDGAQCTMKKMIIDNQLFIFRGNELYNVSGQKVK